MKRFALYLATAATVVASCSSREENIDSLLKTDEIFYASFEQPKEDGTKVYANEDLLLRWTADDRVSIFNKITYNQEYKFTGQTGANSGGFKKVESDEFVTGNATSHVVSVYPYQESTEISESEILTVMLPAEQHYAENTFGLGANTMVSVSSDNVLQYKNVGGYLKISLYGEGVSVSSITLKGNNGEKLAGKATVTMPLDGIPEAFLTEDASDQIILVCDTPVTLGATAENSKDFWLVVPPVTFRGGFTIAINEATGDVFEKQTSKSLAIERNKLSKMSAMKVEKVLPAGNIVFANEKVKDKLVAAFDTNGDGELSYNEAAAVTSGDDLKSAFGAIKTYKSFDEFQYFTGIESIPASMFEGWVMTSIILPDSIKHIGESSFKDCKSLTKVYIPEGVEELASYTFEGCSSLNEIDLPSSLETLSQNVFYGCEALQNIVLPYGFKSIGARCFYNCSNLSTIYLPDSIVTIKEMAFKGCSMLKNVHFDSLDWWLWMCDKTQDTYGTYDTELFSCGSAERHLFINGEELTSIIIPSDISNIGDFAFMGCSNIVSISIPNTVSSIGMYSFMKCDIESIDIPETVSKLGIGAFQSCSRLSSIIIPESVSQIYYNTFMNCTALSSISIPESVVSIGTQAFENCVSLESIEIPQSVTSLGAYAFRGCTGLSAITLPERISVIDIYTFYGCSNLVSIYIPSGVTAINDYAFCGCSSLPNIVLPENLTSIGAFVFGSCSSLSTIDVPSNVTSIGRGAFATVYLNSLTVRSITPPEAGIDLCSWNISAIYVPGESIESYKTAKNWKDYASKIQAISTTNVPIPEAIDLGLSVKWASFNLGASRVEESGLYYAWGETETKDVYDWTTYKWWSREETKNKITKYCNNPESGFEGFSDNKLVLDPEDDAATIGLGGNWRTPTFDELTELRNNCSWTWTSINDVDGYKVTSKTNGNSIFLPVTGNMKDATLSWSSTGKYYSSTLLSTDCLLVPILGFNSGSAYVNTATERYTGLTIRPVCSK